MTSASFNSRLGEVQSLLSSLTKDCNQNEGDRRQLCSVLQESLSQVETPGDFVWRVMLQPHEYATLRTALEMKIPHILAKESQPISATQLSKLAGAEKLLIVRIMRVLTAMNVFVETAPETYTSGAISKFIAETPSMEGGLKFMFDMPANGLPKMPSSLSKSGFANPTGPSIFHEAFGSDTNVFKFLTEHPAMLGDFGQLMAGQRHNRIDWYQFYPVQGNLIDGFEGDGTLLVDCGGATGHELQCFRRKFPDAPGKLVLQDLPETIAQIGEGQLDPSIEKMKHDFFTEQPVKGARGYYFRSIFHDWPDDKCREILRNMMAVMKKGYSKILINDWVIPDAKSPLYPALLDINMMALFGSMERTETQWRELIDSVGGLKVVNIWAVPETEGCIEAMLA